MSNVFDRMAAGSDGNRKPKMQARDTGDVELPSDSVDNRHAEQTREAADVRTAVQELLRLGYIEESRKSDVFRKTILYESEIKRVLDPLDLSIRLDTHRGIALIVVREELDESTPSLESDEWSHPLVRRQRLTLEQSLLIAILRGVFVLHEQESGVGQKPAKMAVDDLLPQYLTYIEDSGSDARNETKLKRLLEQLKGYGMVSEVDANQEITIRPLIAHLANPDSLAALLRTMTEMMQAEDGADG